MVHIKKKKKKRQRHLGLKKCQHTGEWGGPEIKHTMMARKGEYHIWNREHSLLCFPISDWKSHKPLSFRQKRQRQFHTEIVGSMTFWHLSALRMIPAQAKHPKMKIPSQPAVHNYTEFQMSFSLLPFRSKHWTIERQREMIHRYHRK